MNATAVPPTLNEPLNLRRGQFTRGQTDLDQPPA